MLHEVDEGVLQGGLDRLDAQIAAAAQLIQGGAEAGTVGAAHVQGGAEAGHLLGAGQAPQGVGQAVAGGSTDRPGVQAAAARWTAG